MDKNTTAIQAKGSVSREPAAVLAGRYGVTLDTLYRWPGRASFEDHLHAAHHLATTLTPAQEVAVVKLRRMLLQMDVLLAVSREFLNPDVSRSEMDRLLGRHGVNNLYALGPKNPAKPRKAFKTYEPGLPLPGREGGCLCAPNDQNCRQRMQVLARPAPDLLGQDCQGTDPLSAIASDHLPCDGLFQ